MFTQPSVNKIASAYQGNPEPLAQKVDQDKKQNGGVIPKDLRQLMASYDLAQGKQHAGIHGASPDFKISCTLRRSSSLKAGWPVCAP